MCWQENMRHDILELVEKEKNNAEENIVASYNVWKAEFGERYNQEELKYI